MITTPKFRAWDTDNKIMRYGDFGLSWDVVVELLTLPNPNGTYRTALGKQFNGRLMQDTGLKDKNGKSIWQGDVVIIKGHSKPELVIFEEGVFGLKGWVEPLRDLITDWTSNIDPGLIEVIGNVFANPELLSNKEQ